MSDHAEEKYRAPALDKGLDILELLASSPDGMTQAEIAKGLDRRTNEVYRMIETLRRRRYITRTPSGDRYMLSLRLFVLANMHPPRRRLLDIAEPLMRAFAQKAEQSIHLALYEDGQIVIATSFSAPGNWRLALRPGSLLGLYNTGSGVVLAAFSDPATQKALLEEHQLVPGETAMERTAFLAKLEDIRQKGYSDQPSQTVVGAVNLSFPIVFPEGTAIAAITTPYLERIDRYDAPDLHQVTNMLRDVASEIAAQVYGS